MPVYCFGIPMTSVGIVPIEVFKFPLFNTALLIVSSFSITWAHRAIAIGSFREAIDSFLVTIVLGLFFIFLQGYEYYESTFNMSDGIYASVFYMLTGLHGFHVIVGVSVISISFFRLINKHFLVNHYNGFVFAIWYWHFVDIVWILLFLSVYWWVLEVNLWHKLIELFISQC